MSTFFVRKLKDLGQIRNLYIEIKGYFVNLKYGAADGYNNVANIVLYVIIKENDL